MTDIIATPEEFSATLARDGVVRLPTLLSAEQLLGMQSAFAEALKYPSFNTWNGYEQNERWRLLVEHCLRLHSGFVALPLDSLVRTVLQEYLGPDYVLTEARGWQTVATKRNFHGWHNDAWYDTALSAVPRQIKLGLYLSDVKSGQFRYLAGSHRPAPRPSHWNEEQVQSLIADGKHQIVDMQGPAGTAFLFDTCGIHRQASPVLQARQAVFYNFHDPATPLMPSETQYGRYEPLLLSVAHLPVLDAKSQRLLGIGRAVSGNVDAPQRRYPLLHSLVALQLMLRLLWQDGSEQVTRVPRGLRKLWSRLRRA